MRRPDPAAGTAAAVTVAVLLLSLPSVAGCTPVEPGAASSGTEAAHVEEVDAERSRVVLTSDAVARLGLETAAVTLSPSAGRSGRARLAIPYAALLFAPDGTPWTYVAEGDRSYLRAPLTLDSVSAGRALLLAGPPVGSSVVTAGAAELLGTELDVGH